MFGSYNFSKDKPVTASYILIYAAKFYYRVEAIATSVHATKQSEFDHNSDYR